MKKMAKKENEKIATSLIDQAQPAHSRAHAHEGTADGLDIREDEHNYRKHSDKNLSLIGKSLDEFGAGRSIVADSTGAVIGGNGAEGSEEYLVLLPLDSWQYRMVGARPVERAF